MTTGARLNLKNFEGFIIMSGYLKPGYTNEMPYDHPLDRVSLLTIHTK